MNNIFNILLMSGTDRNFFAIVTGVLLVACVILFRFNKSGHFKGFINATTQYIRTTNIIKSVQFVPEAIFTIDSAGKIIYTNNKVRNIFGWLEDEMRGKFISMIIPEQYLSAFDKFKITNSGESNELHLDIEAIRKNGELFPAEITIGQWFSDDDTKTPFYAIVLRDVSQDKLNEEIIRKAEAHISYLRRIYHEGEKVGNVAFWEMNCKTGELQYSPNFTHIFSVRGASDIQVEHLIKRITIDDKVRVAETMIKAKECKSGYDIEYRIHGFDGYINTIHSISSAIKNKKGELTHFIGMARLTKKEKPAWL